jgi:predicted glycoside hydrolase/deacetylase ChbG (UPF0249 family)
MLKLIINADDFGYSKRVNKAILESFNSGIVRSTSLMPNGESFEHAIKIIKSNSDLDIGVHLTLLDGVSILKSYRIASLITDGDYFHKNAIDFAKKYFLGKISFDEVRNELSAQIGKLLDYGIKPSHIDSHQHIHILPGILEIVIELAKKFKIKFIRLPQESFRKYMLLDSNSFTRLLQMVAVNFYCSKSKNKSFFTTDYFAGFYFGGKLDRNNLMTLINHLPNSGTCELMCHPGLDKNNVLGENQYRRVEEADALSDPEIMNLLKLKNIEITSFREIV